MKATDALLADHKMIRKILQGFELDNPRFPEILKLLQRVVIGHATFEDSLFLPAIEKDPRLVRCFTAEIYQEHQDINYFLTEQRRLVDAGGVKKSHAELELLRKQFVAVLGTHFDKEEDALFPMAELILDREGLNKLGEEMREFSSVPPGSTEASS